MLTPMPALQSASTRVWCGESGRTSRRRRLLPARFRRDDALLRLHMPRRETLQRRVVGFGEREPLRQRLHRPLITEERRGGLIVAGFRAAAAAACARSRGRAARLLARVPPRRARPARSALDRGNHAAFSSASPGRAGDRPLGAPSGVRSTLIASSTPEIGTGEVGVGSGRRPRDPTALRRRRRRARRCCAWIRPPSRSTTSCRSTRADRPGSGGGRPRRWASTCRSCGRRSA